MTRRRDDLLDVLLTLVGIGLHVAACDRLEILPPNSGFEALIVVLPLALGAVAVVALAVRGERRPLQVACVVQWLLVLYILPAGFEALSLVPSAAALSVAVFRPRTPVSTDPAETS